MRPDSDTTLKKFGRYIYGGEGGNSSRHANEYEHPARITRFGSNYKPRSHDNDRRLRRANNKTCARPETSGVDWRADGGNNKSRVNAETGERARARNWTKDEMFKIYFATRTYGVERTSFRDYVSCVSLSRRFRWTSGKKQNDFACRRGS